MQVRTWGNGCLLPTCQTLLGSSWAVQCLANLCCICKRAPMGCNDRLWLLCCVA